LRATLEQVERSSGHRDDRLNVPEPAPEVRYLFGLFAEIKAGATEGFSGSRVTWTDLVNYERLAGIMLDPCEVTAIMEMDAAAREVADEEAPDGGDSKSDG
jgi:hypothetical protein